MIPISLLIQLLARYWKPIALGLLAFAVAGIIGLAWHHYERVLADNRRLGAEAAATRVALASEHAAGAAMETALDEWKRAESRRTENERKLADVAAAARRERERVDASLAKDYDPSRLSGDVARAFCVLDRASAGSTRECPGDPAPGSAAPGS